MVTLIITVQLVRSEPDEECLYLKRAGGGGGNAVITTGQLVRSESMGFTISML